MRYPDEIIEEVRMKNDIVDVISGYVHLQKKGNSYFGLCPFHNEKTPSFSVSPDRQMFHCFGCGSGGNVITFVMKYENFSFPEALKFLADRANVHLPAPNQSEGGKKEADLRLNILEVNKLAAEYYYALLRSENGREARDYLAARGISDELIKNFGLGYSNEAADDLYRFLQKRGYSEETMREAGLICANEKRGVYDLFRNRVMFPIMDANSRVIGFGGRVMQDAGPKYLNSPETKVFNKRRNLYGINRARTARKPYFVLCEGYMDVLSLHQAGFSNAVASLGTALTAGQASLIKRYVRQVDLAYDSDEAGIRAALAAVSVLKSADVYTRVIDLSPYKDPDELIKKSSPSEFEKRIASSKDGLMFNVEEIAKKYDLNSPEGKTAFTKEAAGKLAEIEDEIERGNYIEAVSKSYRITLDSFQRLVVKSALPKKKEGLNVSKKTIAPDRKKQTGINTSQKILLTWLSEDEKVFEKIKDYIKPQDFSDGLYRKAAEILFKQLEQGRASPAAVIDHFSSEEEQTEAASLFHASIKSLSDRWEKEKALKDTIAKVKANSIEVKRRETDPSDMEGLQKVVDELRKLPEIYKLHIYND